MPSDEKQPEIAEFVHQFAPDYKLHSVNGIWGGMTPRGDLRIDFFVESLFVPNKVVMEVKADGTLGKELERVLFTGEQPQEGKVVLQREIKCGILVSPEHARNFADFIYQKLGKAQSKEK